MIFLIDARTMNKAPGGIGNYTFNWVEMLRSIPDCHVELISDICESEELKVLSSKGVRIHLLGHEAARRYGAFEYFKFVQKTIDEVKPDVFWETNNAVPVKLGNRYGKMIVTLHDILPITRPECYGKLYPITFRYSLNKTFRCFDAVFFVSATARDEAIEHFPVLKGKKTFIGGQMIFEVPKMELSDNGSFLYLGTLEQRKGLDILLAAYEMYREKGGQRKLRLAGKCTDPSMKELLQKYRDKFGNDITYLGHVSIDQRNREYASCSCFVFPSRGEGFGIPIIEAIQYSKPVIASDLEVFREIAEDSIHYFHLEESLDDSMMNLAKAMMAADSIKVDKSKYDYIYSKFRPKTVAEKFIANIRRMSE